MVCDNYQSVQPGGAMCGLLSFQAKKRINTEAEMAYP